MTTLLRILAGLSALAGFVALGLSAFASDDMRRAHEAHALQLLVLLWLTASILAPFADAWIARRNPSAASLGYLPMVILAATAIVRLLRF